MATASKGAEVEGDLAIADADGTVPAAAARQHGDERLVRARFTCVHAAAIRGPVMILWIRLCTNPWTPLASEPEKLSSSPPIRVRPFCDSSAAA